MALQAAYAAVSRRHQAAVDRLVALPTPRPPRAADADASVSAPNWLAAAHSISVRRGPGSVGGQQWSSEQQQQQQKGSSEQKTEQGADGPPQGAAEEEEEWESFLEGVISYGNKHAGTAATAAAASPPLDNLRPGGSPAFPDLLDGGLMSPLVDGICGDGGSLSPEAVEVVVLHEQQGRRHQGQTRKDEHDLSQRPKDRQQQEPLQHPQHPQHPERQQHEPQQQQRMHHVQGFSATTAWGQSATDFSSLLPLPSILPSWATAGASGENAGPTLLLPSRATATATTSFTSGPPPPRSVVATGACNIEALLEEMDSLAIVLQVWGGGQ